VNLTSQRRIVRASRATYSGLLLFYPRDLRRRFGAEMAEVFEDSLREAVNCRSTAGMLSIWRSTLWELVIVAAPSHLASRSVMAGAMSFLASSILFLVFFRFVS
jgi:hypothetical protein